MSPIVISIESLIAKRKLRLIHQRLATGGVVFYSDSAHSDDRWGDETLTVARMQWGRVMISDLRRCRVSLVLSNASTASELGPTRQINPRVAVAPEAVKESYELLKDAAGCL